MPREPLQLFVRLGLRGNWLNDLDARSRMLKCGLDEISQQPRAPSPIERARLAGLPPVLFGSLSILRTRRNRQTQDVQTNITSHYDSH